MKMYLHSPLNCWFKGRHLVDENLIDMNESYIPADPVLVARILLIGPSALASGHMDEGVSWDWVIKEGFN